ncbi:MAG: HlyD family efflux transporter periplasmic adaptor subunit [Salinarimonas sp.]
MDGQEHQAADLPLADPGVAPAAGRGGARARRRGGGALRGVLLVMGLLFAGAAVGLYFQPPALRAFFAVTGLEPGGGSARPIAVAPAVADAPRIEERGVREGVVALGRLVPQGDVLTLAAPFGAGDARIAALLVEEGERVSAGDTVALLDNGPALESALDAAAAAVAVREAALAQTRAGVAASLRETRAEVARAQSALALAEAERDRSRDLHARGVTTAAALARAETEAMAAAGELERARAALSRWMATPAGEQPDVVLAERNLDAARADRAAAERDLSKARVAAPVDGTILSLRARVGERPGAGGVATLADTARMTVELEVYQTDIRHVAPGQPVEIQAQALGEEPLSGRVARIGLEVGRQTLVAGDPAANTDARVVEVVVVLDPASSARAARLTGLEVTGRIVTDVDG